MVVILLLAIIPLSLPGHVFALSLLRGHGLLLMVLYHPGYLPQRQAHIIICAVDCEFRRHEYDYFCGILSLSLSLTLTLPLALPTTPALTLRREWPDYAFNRYLDAIF